MIGDKRMINRMVNTSMPPNYFDDELTRIEMHHEGELLSMFPEFNDDWDKEVQLKWFEVFEKLAMDERSEPMRVVVSLPEPIETIEPIETE